MNCVCKTGLTDRAPSSLFLFFLPQDDLRICVLPTHLSYDAPWPVRKVPLRCTPHFITYHLESKTYAVISSAAEPTNQVRQPRLQFELLAASLMHYRVARMYVQVQSQREY